MRGVRSFLGHAGFYRRFIKDFSNISKPLSNLLMQGVPYDFDDSCMKAFETLKEKLISALVIIAPDWDLPFELMCDARDYVVGIVFVTPRFPVRPDWRIRTEFGVRDSGLGLFT